MSLIKKFPDPLLNWVYWVFQGFWGGRGQFNQALRVRGLGSRNLKVGSSILKFPAILKLAL